MLEKLLPDEERVVRQFAPLLRAFVQDENLQPPFTYDLYKSFPLKYHRNWGKEERKKMIMEGLLNKGYIHFYRFNNKNISICFIQEKFIDYYESYLEVE